MKLRTKILLPISIISICAVLALGGISYFFAKREVIRIYRDQIESTIVSLEEEIKITEQVQDVVISDVRSRNLSLTKVLAQFISLRLSQMTPPAQYNAAELQALADQLGVSEIHVIDANGGTRCASITGASVALQLAFRNLMARKQIQTFPMRENVAAVSVGMKNGECLLDLCYEEDSSADVDMNVVMTESGRIVEVQGTAEEKPFTREELDTMLNLAKRGLDRLFEDQRKAVGNEALPKPSPKTFGSLGSVLDNALKTK